MLLAGQRIRESSGESGFSCFFNCFGLNSRMYKVGGLLNFVGGRVVGLALTGVLH